MSLTQKLINQVSQRAYLATLAGACRWCLVILGGVALLLLCAARLGGLFVEPANWVFGVGILSGALALGMWRARRISAAAAARLIDGQAKTRDLFLTVASSAGTGAGFESIVQAQAEQSAAGIRPSQVVPFGWQRGTRDVIAMVAVLLVAWSYLPRLDPFGKAKARAKIELEAKRLEETKKLSAQRIEVLAQNAAANQEKLKQAITSLEKTFQKAVPVQKEANLARLAEHQKELGEMWRKNAMELPKDAFDKAAQSFGKAGDAKQLDKWREALKKGEVGEVKKQVSELREQLKALASMPEGEAKRERQQELAKKLNELAETAKAAGASPALNAALARAQEQMDQSKLSELSKEAAEAAGESLALSEQELEQIAKQMQEGKTLEDALKSVQMAKQLAAKGQLGEGEQGQGGQEGQGAGGKSMSDYEKLFKEKMAQQGEGEGEGQGELAGRGGSGMGPGRGNGALRPEDETAKTGFKTEKSQSALTGGKLLMQWNSSEVGESGARPEEYQERIKEVKQGVSEAIRSENVPQGYHEVIQKYFDSLPQK